MKTTHRLMAVLVAMGLVLGACSRSGKTSTEDTGGSTKALADGNFGSLKEVCGKGDGDNTGTGTGISPDSVTLATIADPGSSIRPGLNQEIFDAGDVFVKWCNSLGGINGRQIQLQKLDAELFQHKQRILEACQSAFALVGNGGVFDDQGQEDRVKCMLPQFPGFLTNPTARSSDLTVQSTPTPVTGLNIGILRWLKAQFPNTKKIGVLTGSVPTLITTAGQFQAGAESLGFETVYNKQYNSTGEATWVPFAQSIKESGVEGLIYIGEPTDFAKLAQALDLIDYKLDWAFPSSNIYDQKLMTLAGSALHNVFIPRGTATFESVGDGTRQGKAMADYQALFKEYLPNGDAKAILGVNTFSSWLMFATAAKECGAKLTRKCVYENAMKIHSWDGGGLTVPANPGGDLASECFGVVEATPSGFKVRSEGANTDKNLNCDPANVFKLTPGPKDQGPKMSDFGKSLNDLS